MKIILIILLLLTSTTWPQLSAEGQNATTTTGAEALIQDLPAAYRDAARKSIGVFLTSAMVANQQRLFGTKTYTKSDWTRGAFLWMFQTPEGKIFLMKRLDDEPDGALRVVILKAARVASQMLIEGHPKVILSSTDLETIAEHAKKDPDPDAALAALDVIHSLDIAKEKQLLVVRRKQKDSSSLRDVYLSRYDWFGEIRNTAFPPPVFSVVPADKPIRVLAFGDFGTGSADQIKDAATMAAYQNQHPFDFGLTLGDNFYMTGLNTPSDPRWQTDWERLYGPLGIKFYPVYGNHEYADPDSPAAELAYTARSKTWVFPAAYYTFTAGAVQFFAIDNIRMPDDELEWLDKELSKSTSKWKIVYGHYPIYSATRGDNDESQDNLIGRLLPILERNHVQIYLNGHDHNMQATQTSSPVHFFTSGAGGAVLYDMEATYKKTIFRDRQFGFTVVEADPQHVDVIFVDQDGREVYRSHITD